LRIAVGPEADRRSGDAQLPRNSRNRQTAGEPKPGDPGPRHKAMPGLNAAHQQMSSRPSSSPRPTSATSGIATSGARQRKGEDHDLRRVE
jgi:hypothetical protein